MHFPCIFQHPSPNLLQLGPWSKLNHQRFFIPQNKALLVRPVIRRLVQFHVKVEDHASKNDSHLDVCQTKKIVNKKHSSSTILKRYTDFRPIQFLGPKLKGCITVLLSFSNSGSSRNRSGMNLSGCLKFIAEWYAAICVMDTIVYS